MLEQLNKLFTETVKLSQDLWLYILLAVVGVTFLIALIVGLAAGEFNKTKSLMKRVVAQPSSAVACMKQMPPVVKKEYKRARMANVEPSAFVTEADCVDRPYARSLVSKIWLVTLIATIVCAAIGFFVAPLAAQSALAAEAENGSEPAIEVLAEGDEEGTGDASGEEGGEQGGGETVKPLDPLVLANATFIMPMVILAVGGLLTLIGGIVGVGARSGAHGIYAKFAVALDGSAPGAQQEAQPQQNAYGGDNGQGAQQVYAEAQPMYAEPQEAYAEAQPMYGEPQQAYAEAQPMYGEPQGYAEQPVYEEPQQQPVFATPVQDMNQPSEEEMRKRARDEAIARARAEQEAQQAAQAAARQQAAAQQQAAQAAAAQAAARQQAPQTAAQSAGSSSADEVIARIEQIDREGAPRETMREVAALLQKERQKPENKTPEQQKKLNEALSKLLKAMSAASRK